MQLFESWETSRLQGERKQSPHYKPSDEVVINITSDHLTHRATQVQISFIFINEILKNIFLPMHFFIILLGGFTIIKLSKLMVILFKSFHAVLLFLKR